jgi:hypothetical protein
LPTASGLHQLRQYRLDLPIQRMIDHRSHSLKISELDQDRHRGRQHRNATRALGGQRVSRSRPFGAISLTRQIGRFLIQCAQG